MTVFASVQTPDVRHAHPVGRNAGGDSVPALVAAINRCERALRAAFPQVRWLFFEPDTKK